MQRITNSIMVSDLLQNLNERMRTLNELQIQVATGRQVNYASDDPAAAGLILELRNHLRQNVQFQENVENAQAWLMNTESSLQELNDILIDARADAVQGGNGSMTPEDMAQLAEEINSFLENVFSLSNADYNGKSIFGGTNTQDAAFTAMRDPVTGWITSVIANPLGTDGAMMRQIDTNNTMQINVAGADVFMPNGAGSAEDMFSVLIDLRDALVAGDATAVGDTIPRIDLVMENVTDFSSLAGTKVGRLEFMTSSLLNEETQLTAHKSDKEDADLVELMTQMTLEQNAYQVALNVGSGVIQPTLVNFI
jgi:flagellar hook-associated protein 3 FlgL